MVYLYGQYKSQTTGILKDIDMKMAFTTKDGKVKIGENLYQLNRVAVNYDTTLSQFKDAVVNLRAKEAIYASRN